jgi:hypothetical protein
LRMKYPGALVWRVSGSFDSAGTSLREVSIPLRVTLISDDRGLESVRHLIFCVLRLCILRYVFWACAFALFYRWLNCDNSALFPFVEQSSDAGISDQCGRRGRGRFWA